ncbi:hypothetical protein A1O1_04940 [Capronia coronata CBS 617.96]|uniref:C3H1-type domain-containing protein n=1 Tax=Capronia coronata CBS 617.96 TaxID=1182541 RepID=W9Y654_9EURO|nr:uncharacterized protein A1O1_04940 [Capronia coronata CBS 617.96]EXJ88013.1 hypothetical protein A1O1_04940 [Capronia coronata CBS 617.96]
MVCSYAHWDTGRLASHFQQRGTCMAWKVLGYCGRGGGCWYEHRLTGVTGLYQGTIELTGSELQIADAASKAGFDTFRHEALFELIWAVKRIALRSGSCQFKSLPMPRDLIYPDRYRPNRVGDNTNTKRKRKAMAKKQAASSLIELKFHPIPPLMRKRTVKSRLEEGDLIELSYSDNEITMDFGDTTAGGGGEPKRQKVSGSQNCQNIAAPVSTQSNNRRKGISSAATGSNAVPLVGGKRSNAKALRDPPTSIAPVARALTVEGEISKQLLLVKTNLEDARKNMNNCQATMKALFDVHQEKFDDDETMAALRKLSECMNKVFDGGKEGACEIDKVVAWLSDRKDNIL